MGRLNLYMFRQTLVAFLFAVIAVTFVVLFTQSFRLLSFVIDNAGTALVFFQLMGLLIPTFLPLVLPLALGVAVLFIYHKFTVDGEIVVMRASGVSPLRLAAPALALAILVTMLGFALTTWISPAAHRQLVKLQYRVRDNFSIYLVRPGTFNDVSDGLTFYVRARGKEGALQDILVHDIRKPERPVTIMAESGQFLVKDGEPQIIVFKGKRQEIDSRTGRLSQLDFDRYVLDLNLLRSSTSNRLPDPREASLAQLLFASSETVPLRGSLERRMAEVHQRLTSPWLALGYTFIAVAVILAGPFNRRGMAKRILTAAIAIIALQAAMMSLINLVGKHIELAFALYLVALVPVLIGLGVLGDRLSLRRARKVAS